MEKELTLEEIRQAQAEIATEMSLEGLTRSRMANLEQTSFHLRNLERLLVATMEKQLISELKRETLSLSALTEEMDRATKQLSALTLILRKVVKMAGQIIDMLEIAG